MYTDSSIFYCSILVPWRHAPVHFQSHSKMCRPSTEAELYVLSCPHHVRSKILCQNQWLKLQPLQKTVWQFLKQLNMELPYDLAIPLLGTYSKEMKTSTQTNTYPKMFLTAKDENSPNVCQWMNRVYPCSRTLFGHKNKWSTDTYYHMDESPSC